MLVGCLSLNIHSLVPRPARRFGCTKERKCRKAGRGLGTRLEYTWAWLHTATVHLLQAAEAGHGGMETSEMGPGGGEFHSFS